VLVMYLGRAVEYGPKRQIFAQPAHPYTRALLAATPVLAPRRGRERGSLGGELPSPLNPPSGCAFHKRCPFAVARCSTEVPGPTRIGEVEVACHRASEIN